MKFKNLNNSLERFLLCISNSTHPRGCWIWEGFKSHNGYGRLRITNNKRIPSHRFSYELFKGNIPQKLLVCHHCDNPSCVNPDHLWIGTHKENMHDMIRKQRGGFGSGINLATIKRRKGITHPRAKLNEEKVLEMRELSKKGMTNRALGIKFNISESTVSGIVLRKEWKHV